MSEPEAFVGAEWYEIKGRGWVATMSLPEPRRLGDLRALKGARISVDGREMTVRGVETYALGDDAHSRNVGFLVDASPHPRTGDDG